MGREPSRNVLLVLFVSVFALMMMSPGLLQAQSMYYMQTNLVGSDSAYAGSGIVDSNLINPWGIANGPATPIWLADQGSNRSTLYWISNSTSGVKATLAPTTSHPLVVSFPKMPSAMMQGPTGIVYNPAQSIDAFLIPAANGTVPAFYIYDTLSGTIAAWSKGSKVGPTMAEVVVNTPGAVYKGLAIAQMDKAWRLYAADATAMGGIKVFNEEFQEVAMRPNAFMDPDLPTLPSGDVWITFNVENVGGNLFVTYAPMQMAKVQPPILTSDAGVVAEFTPKGRFMRNVIVSPWHTSNRLDDPWGLVMATNNFGRFSNDLLVGNFGNGEILAYKPTSAGMYTFAGTLENLDGDPITDGRLWDLSFGNKKADPNMNTLFITTGGSMPKMDGLFAAIKPARPLP